ncbi:MAG: isoprenylcysteine carboxylmethyltransferase family protein [Candidatus Acidiferrales bacterium]
MEPHSDKIAQIVFYAVIFSWCFFAAIFFSQKKPPKAKEKKRGSASRLGILIQGVAFFSVWFFHRPNYSPIVPMPEPAEIALGIVTVVIASASVWIVFSAVRTLGKQWAYQARIVEGHELITQGPYGLVRNPIYLGILGFLVAAGLAVSRWEALLASTMIFLIGNEIRVRSEEKLLREAFGAQFDEYAQRVPAFFPRLFRS